MVIKGYVFGSPPLVGASFGMPTSSVGPWVPHQLAPSCPFSLPSCSPLAPSCSSHSLSLPMANVGYWYVILCFGVPTTSVGARGKKEQEGARGARGSERGQEGVRGVRGRERSKRE